MNIVRKKVTQDFALEPSPCYKVDLKLENFAEIYSSEMPKLIKRGKLVKLVKELNVKKVLQSLDVCLVKNDKDVLLVSPALLAIILAFSAFWEVLMMLFSYASSSTLPPSSASK